MGDICCSVAVSKNEIISLWYLWPGPVQFHEDACSLALVYSLACQPRFADPHGLLGGLHWWPGSGQRVTKLGLAACSFWHEMVSGSE